MASLPLALMRHNRLTGKVAGIVPISPSDYVQTLPPLKSRLWRYVEKWKVLDMLKHATLYLRRSDSFEDPLEGTLPAETVWGASQAERLMRNLFPTNETFASRGESQVPIRQNTFVNCWQRAEGEVMHMWETCREAPNCVAIQTTFGTLKRSISAAVQFSAIKYVRDDEPRPEFDYSALFFYKNLKYRYERELRILYQPCNEVGVKYSADGLGVSVPINLRRFARGFVFHPGMGAHDKRELRTVLGRACPKARISRSKFS